MEPTSHVGQKNLPAELCLASLTHASVRSSKMVAVLNHDALGQSVLQWHVTVTDCHLFNLKSEKVERKHVSHYGLSTNVL